MRFIPLLFILTSCQYYFQAGDCFIERGIAGGYHKVLKVAHHTYITYPYGTYEITGMAGMPRIIPMDTNLVQIDCFEGKFKDDYMDLTDEAVFHTKGISQ